MISPNENPATLPRPLLSFSEVTSAPSEDRYHQTKLRIVDLRFFARGHMPSVIDP
jgi:hypothetical protein